MSEQGSQRFTGAWLALLLASSGMTACTAEVHTVHPGIVAEDEVEVDTVPVDVYAYPHTEYRGHTVYYVNGRWYHPRGNRWSYYRNEPPELVRHRGYVEQAPPARRPHREPPGEAIRVR